MRFLKPIVSLVMALLIGVTSLGVAVSAHTCAESGFSEAGIGHLKICCKVAEGKGFRAEPCCKLSVQQVKLATVRTATDAAPLQLLKWQAPAPVLPMVAPVPQPAFASTALQARPPEPPPLLATVDAQAFIRQFLI